MGWFSKKEKVPELPPAPKFPELPKSEEKETHELPSLPNNLGENLNHAIVKSAVDDFSEGEAAIPAPPKQEPEKRTLEISEEPEKTKEAEPIFVRIDRFQEAQKNFKEIKNKVSSIEKILRRVREKKEKEDREISLWVQDLEKIKARLAEIDSEIFNQI